MTEPSSSPPTEVISVLLVEDDEKLARLVKQYLESHGLIVTWASDGTSGLQYALRHSFDVILLDLTLPGLDGLGICRKLREHRDVPIIMVTAREEEADRVLGLELGADDYVAKPFSSRELLARIRAQVRRSRGKVGPANRVLLVQGLVIDPRQMRATRGQRNLELTTTDFKLLYALADRAGHVLSREQLLDLTKGTADEVFDRTVDANISRLLKKIGDDPSHPSILITVRGVGYMLAPGGSE